LTLSHQSIQPVLGYSYAAWPSLTLNAAILNALMVRTVIIAGFIALALLITIVVITLISAPTTGAEYTEFALALAMFLVILLGSYLWIVRGPGSRM
jgi:hypothetical protein